MTSTLTPPRPPAASNATQQFDPDQHQMAEGSPGSRPTVTTRALAADLIGLGILGTLAIFGFRNAYGGTRFFVAGAVGLLTGMALAWVGSKFRLGTLPMAIGSVAAYFIVGGVVVAPGETLVGFVPTAGSVTALADGAVGGWARLLTSLPPVGDADNLLAVPFLCGILCGLLALTVAVRSRRPLLAIVFPAAVLAIGILFGTQVPASLVLQGSVFAVVALAWSSYQYQTRRRIDTGRRRSTRWVGIVAMLGLAAVISGLFGGSIPGSGRPRFVLRDDVEPPFDPSDYPSPLITYRKYTDGPRESSNKKLTQKGADSSEARSGWRHTELFKVTGLPEDEPLRLATLDNYSDGIVYEVGTGQASSGYFRRVGESVKPHLAGATGKDRSVEVEILEGTQKASDGSVDSTKPPTPYSDIWLPLPANPTSVEFSGADSDRNSDLLSSLRLNEVTGAAAVPMRLGAGDRYKVSFVDVAKPDMRDLDAIAKLSLGKEKLPSPYKVNQVFQQAPRFSGGEIAQCSDKGASEKSPDTGASSGEKPNAAFSPLQRVWEIAKNLRTCGGLDDGEQSQGGHGSARLSQMVDDLLLGNGEQFAPLAALMSDAIGVDARVVMGFRSRSESDEWRKAHADSGLAPSSGDEYVVAGADVAAWIEVNVKGYGWVPLDVTPDKEEPVKLPEPESQKPLNEPPPPPPSLPPSEDDEIDINKANNPSSCSVNPDAPDCNEGGIPWGAILKWISIPLLPVAIVALVTGIIAGLKGRRRNRRRREGPPDVRVKGGWDEVTDLACDLGSPVPSKATRREAAGLIANPDATRLARRADGAVFGPNDLDDAEVERYWNEVDAVRASMVRNLSRFGRWKVLVSVSSLRLASQRNRAARQLARAQGRKSQPSRRGGRKAPGGSDGQSSLGHQTPAGATDSGIVAPGMGVGLR